VKASITRSVAVQRTARVAQLEGIFDLPPSQRSEQTWSLDLPLEERDWNVGLVVGPSGTGKSTMLRELWGDRIASGYEWPNDRAIVDGFPAELGTREVVELLSSVGFSSPPAWLRPYSVLSNGEQFRAHVARALAEAGTELVVLDEFTSVVDRTVAQIGSAAIAKAVRRRGAQIVAATCHYDVEDWLQPDWVFQPHVNAFTWRSVQPDRVSSSSSRAAIRLRGVSSDRITI
jgi:ABC-type ATPase with predicted acetyltransferase domain